VAQHSFSHALFTLQKRSHANKEVKPISAPPRVFVSGKKQIISTVNTAVGKTVGEALVQTFA